MDLTSNVALEIFNLFWMLLRDKKFGDIAFSYSCNCIKSLREFNNTKDMLAFARQHPYCTILFKRVGASHYCNSIGVQHITGFKLNTKSLTLLIDITLGVGRRSGKRLNIRF